MSQNDDVSKQGRKAVTPDALIKPTEKGEVTLTEEELSRVSGGKSCATGQHIKKAVLTVR
jgi:hypothetical protein